MSARSDGPEQFGDSGSSDRPRRPEGDRPSYGRPRDSDRDRGGYRSGPRPDRDRSDRPDRPRRPEGDRPSYGRPRDSEQGIDSLIDAVNSDPLGTTEAEPETRDLPSLRFQASRWLQRESVDAPSRVRIREDHVGDSKVRPQRPSMRGKSRSAMRQLLARAAEAYERDRFEETLRITRRIDAMDPDEPEVLELMGLSLYRLARYDAALRVLRKMHKATESFDQVPVLMDCARALGRINELDRWWLRLREASPAKEVIVEGRIVYAGALADQGKLAEAITLMEQGLGKERRGTALTSIRQRYLLAQLFERAGDASGAREIYLQLFKEDKSLYDVAERLAALS
ncbi:tetratricopeptide repeat protein [Ferrimicrobium acidiphilum]|uniref:Uncharacterized protein n=4 Tax=Ferrimicrobium acidiphilum TaxID=121039 RepID=A0A0D8FY12_9ACTN|nr:hypothetical protein [Ferrimicrobium acidiphilum]KJE77844.1 hypothetical protein FEAC_02160 [Ferrimicrobium acidiphilum DSM 19497]